MTLAGLYLIAGTAAVLALAQSRTTSDRTAQNLAPERLASGILGSRLENKDGLYLGGISELIIDPRSGETRYAVVSFGGFFGVGSSSTVFPASQLAPADVKRDTWVMDITWKQWKQAPPARLDSEPETRKAIAYFTTLTSGSRPNPALPHPGRSAVSARPLGSHLPVTALLGRSLRGADGRSLGKISDIALDIGNSKEASLVVATRKNRFVALPLQGVTTKDGVLVHEGKDKAVPLGYIAAH